MKFSIVKPSVMMYKTSDLCGEVSDELLFGTTLEIISEDDTTAFCRTDYGYCGYINRWEVCECDTEDCGESEKVTVYSRCDLLPEPEYRLAPVMSLPKGARIKIYRKFDGRFSQCVVGSKILYIPNFALLKKSSANIREDIAETALGYLGTPYRWGGKSDTGIDCSGLVFMSCRLCGRVVWRDSVPCDRYVQKIPASEVGAGDIAYFDGHVAVMTGKETFVHASASRGKVVCGKFGDGMLSENDVKCFARVKEQF